MKINALLFPISFCQLSHLVFYLVGMTCTMSQDFCKNEDSLLKHLAQNLEHIWFLLCHYDYQFIIIINYYQT